MALFTEHVVEMIRSIPAGKVMTYGQIARLAGSPRAARQVVRVLHSMSTKYNLPWHRVINSKGEIGFKDDESYVVQKLSLESEGVEFVDDRHINLDRCIFYPDHRT